MARGYAVVFRHRHSFRSRRHASRGGSFDPPLDELRDARRNYFAAAFFAGAFLATAFFAGAFFAGAFLATAFLATAFFAGAFLATAFFAGAFLATAFFAAAFFAGAAFFAAAFFAGAAFFTAAFLAGAAFFAAVATFPPWVSRWSLTDLVNRHSDDLGRNRVTPAHSTQQRPVVTTVHRSLAERDHS